MAKLSLTAAAFLLGSACLAAAAGRACKASATSSCPAVQNGHVLLQLVKHKRATQAAPRVSVSGRQILVDGQPLHMKGICWHPTARGLYNRPDFRGYLNRDLPLMKLAGINAIRTYGVDIARDRQLLDAIYAEGMWVVPTVYASGGTPASVVTDEVLRAKDHPAILMWSIANEWNYNGIYSGLSHGDSISRINWVASLVRQADPNRPISTVYGELPSSSTLAAMPLIDVWGINSYRGISFGNLMSQWAELSGKPMYLGEYGADAYNANIRREDEESQAEATTQLTQEIVDASTITGGVCSGGFLFEFSDEWWKDGSGSPWEHDVGGIAPGGGPHPDKTFNEEWWGIVDIDRAPRRAFQAYAQVANPSQAPAPSPAPAGNHYRRVLGVGGWGGWCMCPDGQRYNVGDNGDSCGSLACEGGTPGQCMRQHDDSRSGMKVTCANVGSQPEPSPSPQPAGNHYRQESGVGSWGGWCTCPDGQRYNVGDNGDSCGSLACEGGTPGQCMRQHDDSRSGMKVTCGMPAGSCAPFWQWPDVDDGVTCGSCTALVETAPYSNRCDRYCESFGHICTAAAEEVRDSCEVRFSARCDEEISRTSDMLCTCQANSTASSPSPGVPAPPPSPSPGSSCAPFSQWPDVDNGVTCGSCTALVETAPYSNRCDRYCESFGHVCTAAAEERRDSCEVRFSAHCDEEISRTSDMLCTCEQRS